ncbi:MAG: TetR/AcrR family transcriptional regulator [Bacteroidales bacterium]|nr:TetR/AcrR family transcriptional regulator [Bacteroidales bacterium]
MENIAEELHITKKTLYNNFESKEEMISTVVEHFFFNLEEKIIDYLNNSSNAIESLIGLVHILHSEIDRLGTRLLEDVSNENLGVFTYTSRSSFYFRVIKDNLIRGIKEKLYREDIDIELCTLFYTSAIELFYKKGNIQKYMNDSCKFHSELVKHHLYSVVKPECIGMLESYLVK